MIVTTYSPPALMWLEERITSLVNAILDTVEMV